LPGCQHTVVLPNASVVCTFQLPIFTGYAFPKVVPSSSVLFWPRADPTRYTPGKAITTMWSRW